MFPVAVSSASSETRCRRERFLRIHRFYFIRFVKSNHLPRYRNLYARSASTFNAYFVQYFAWSLASINSRSVRSRSKSHGRSRRIVRYFTSVRTTQNWSTIIYRLRRNERDTIVQLMRYLFRSPRASSAFSRLSWPKFKSTF